MATPNPGFPHWEDADPALRMRQHNRLFGWLAIAAGLIFLQGYMIALLIPRLAEIFDVSAQVVGWRVLFWGTAAAAAIVLWRLRQYGALFDDQTVAKLPSMATVFAGYRAVLSSFRGFRTYGYVLWNGVYHSGLYTWLGFYMVQHYDMDALGIGLTILGYGIPGLIFSPLIGKAVDRWGRRWLIPPGLAMAALAGLAMIAQIPPIATTAAILILSLGYDFTQPLFVGIVTDLGDGHNPGQTMGLKVFTLFTGFGIGSWVFGEALRWGFGPTLMVFGGMQLVAAIAAIPLFWNEKRRDLQTQASD